MPAGKKKKAKATSNPARGFATVSIQSKRQTEASLVPGASADASATESPVPGTTPTIVEEEHVRAIIDDAQRGLHELSPEELERQLELSDLQQFVERHAAKVKKETSRQTSRLKTDKRVLRSQAEYVQIKQWLPDELMQQVIDLTVESQMQDVDDHRTLPNGDDLVVKVWQLHSCLLDLDLPSQLATDAINFVLLHPPSQTADGLIWGLGAVLEWLALHDGQFNVVPYDAQKLKISVGTEDNLSDSVSTSDFNDDLLRRDQYALKDVADSVPDPAETEEDMEISDLDSDVAPDELLSIYLRTKAKLFEVDPGAEQPAKAKKPRQTNGNTVRPTKSTKSVQKLRQKLQDIETDVLFDKYEADAKWASIKIDLTKIEAERKKMRLDLVHSDDLQSPEWNDRQAGEANSVARRAQDLGKDALMEAEELDEDCILGGMFDALPGVQDAGSSNGAISSTAISMRDFGRVIGMSPKRILEEACKARDSGVKMNYKLVSSTTYASRHSVSINWSKEQDHHLDASSMPALLVQSKPKVTTVTMKEVATPDVAQSEAFVAVASLYLIFSGSAKEEKAHLRLPPAYRDLWDEFAQSKQERIDEIDREVVKQIKGQIESAVKINLDQEEDDENEVVFNANFRRRTDGVSRASTPITKPDTARPLQAAQSGALRAMWMQKTSSNSYQNMLLSRAKLPMYHARHDALDAISSNQVIILVGDTGSGKSTQLPALILDQELSQGRHCNIICTEPRRISAISLAQRVSEELGERKGDVGTSRSLVGYAIRLETQTSNETRLTYATVGIVLRMLENNDGLKEFTHLIIDEVHERSIDTDFLLIVLRSLMLSRPDLKVVLMSATVDAQKFSDYLNGAPVVSVSGRTFPVQTFFLEDAVEITGHTIEDASNSADGEDDESDERSQSKIGNDNSLASYSKRTRNTLISYDEYRIDYSLIIKLLEKVAVRHELQKFSSAILVFLPGIAEIRRLNDQLVGHTSFRKGWRVHALHSSFSSEDQQAAFEIPPHGTRKIVLATNIAETGITIPDVTCVIDTGKHKEMRFDERRQMSRLIQSFIARANAKQRRGRAGRVQEGVCFHLFTRYRHDSLMVEQQTPEMLRLSLQDLVMRVKICKLGDIEGTLSQALDPPSAKNIRRAIDALIEVDALTPGEELTPLGLQLAKLPLDAQLGKLILLSSIYGCLDFGLTIGAMLSSKSPFASPMNARKQADSVRLAYRRGDSDLLTAYNAYCAWRKTCSTPGQSEYAFCNKNFLSPANLAGIEDLKGQLLGSLADAGFVALGPAEKADMSRLRHHSRHRHFVSLPPSSNSQDGNDLLITSVIGWAFYPKVVKQEGKGWRNMANNQSLGLHPTSVNRTSLPSSVRYLSFYSIMQSSSHFTNAQETSAMTDFAMALLAGDAIFHMYAGVIVIDGNRLRLKVRDPKTMVVLKTLRTRFREVLVRLYKHPGRGLGGRLKAWMEVFQELFGRQQQPRSQPLPLR